MKFIPVKGTRDFYPEVMRMRNWISDTWREVSLRNGFEEYDSPIFEYLDLFTAKSGPEIASQLFNFTDRGGRNLAIRPEITPSLARMVNAKINALPRPIKWFSIPRLCRAENPQKGRLREFFQWNVDIIGPQYELADAECVLTCVDAMRRLGLTSSDVQVRYSSRELLSEVLDSSGIASDNTGEVMSVLDKRSKLPAETFDKMLSEAVGDPAAVTKILQFLDTASMD
ncbi:MAG: histidine--tRNA ligase, partial [bacterium]|nr:histidine--tRNA ligase [bacterium]